MSGLINVTNIINYSHQDEGELDQFETTLVIILNIPEGIKNNTGKCFPGRSGYDVISFEKLSVLGIRFSKIFYWTFEVGATNYNGFRSSRIVIGNHNISSNLPDTTTSENIGSLAYFTEAMFEDLATLYLLDMQFIHPCVPVFESSEGHFKKQYVWYAHLLYDSAKVQRMISQNIQHTPEKYAVYNFSLFAGANVQFYSNNNLESCDRVKLIRVPNRVGAFHLQRESNGFVIDLTSDMKVCWWWMHSGDNQTWRKYLLPGEPDIFLLQSREKTVYLRLVIVPNTDRLLQLIAVNDRELASKFYLESEYLCHKEFVEMVDGNKTSQLITMQNICLKSTIQKEYFNKDLQELRLFLDKSDSLNVSKYWLDTISLLDADSLQIIFDNLIFLVKPHDSFPVLTLEMKPLISENDFQCTQTQLQIVLIGLQQIFNFIFKPELYPGNFIKDFRSRPGWSIALNLQFFGREETTSHIWLDYLNILGKNKSTFGFVHLQPWVYYSFLTTMGESANTWLTNYELNGHLFKPI